MKGIIFVLMLITSSLSAQTYQEFGGPATHVIENSDNSHYYTTAFDVVAAFDSKGQFKWVLYKTAAMSESHTPIMHGTEVRKGLWQQTFTGSDGITVKITFEMFSFKAWYYRVYQKKGKGWKLVNQEIFYKQ